MSTPRDPELGPEEPPLASPSLGAQDPRATQAMDPVLPDEAEPVTPAAPPLPAPEQTHSLEPEPEQSPETKPEPEPKPEAEPKPEPAAAKPPKQRRPRGTLLRRGLRFTGGIGVLAATAGIVLVSGFLPEPASVNAGPLDVAVPATQVALVCPGPVSNSGAGGSDSALSGASVVTGAATAVVLERDDAAGEARFGTFPQPETALESGADALTGTVRDPAGATVLLAEPTQQAAWALASVVQRSDAGDLRGLAATSCPAAGSQAWFAAGRTEVGDSAVLTLRNPGATAATVTLRVWGATGEIALEEAPVVVGAGQEASVTLEAIAPDVDRLALAVSASGGQVSATLATRQLDGLTPAGIDVLGSSAPPATLALVPGLALAESAVEAQDASLVRILNPGQEVATVQVELLGESGSLSLVPGGLVIEPGTVSDVSLAGAPAGTYALRVTSTAPVVAGASLVRPGTPAPEDPDVPVVDRAWVPSVAAATDSAVTVAGLGEQVSGASVSVGNADETQSADVTIIGLDASGAIVAEREVSLAATTSTAVPLADLAAEVTTVRITSDLPVSASVVATGTDAFGEIISVLTAQADPQVERSAAVRLTGD